MKRKEWFGRKRGEEGEMEVEDLITLGRLEEAAQRLRERIKGWPKDLHARLRLGEVLLMLRQVAPAAEEWMLVAGEYARDGFYDKALALLGKVSRLLPHDSQLAVKMEGLRQAKEWDRKRELALEALLERGQYGKEAGGVRLEIESLWNNLAGCSLVLRTHGEQLRRLFASMDVVRVQTGAVIAEQDQILPELYLIGRGRVDVTAQTGGSEGSLQSFAPGEIIGESCLLEHQTWPASYRAAEPTTLLRLTRRDLEGLLQGNPDPRGLLESLREQRRDARVRSALARLSKGRSS